MKNIKFTSIFSITAMLIIAGCSDNSMDQETASAEAAPASTVSYTHLTLPTILLV